MNDEPTADTPRAHAGRALVKLRRRVDAHFDAAVARSPSQMSCRAGCSDCCRAGLSVFAIEADAIAAALRRLPKGTRATVAAQADDANRPSCALLVEGLCTVYEVRPLLCRSHGLAVRPTAHDGTPGDASALQHCPLNYRDEGPPAASVLALDAVNQPLSVMARMWGEGRITLAQLAADATPGRGRP